MSYVGRKTSLLLNFPGVLFTSVFNKKYHSPCNFVWNKWYLGNLVWLVPRKLPFVLGAEETNPNIILQWLSNVTFCTVYPKLVHNRQVVDLFYIWLLSIIIMFLKIQSEIVLIVWILWVSDHLHWWSNKKCPLSIAIKGNL